LHTPACFDEKTFFRAESAILTLQNQYIVSAHYLVIQQCDYYRPEMTDSSMHLSRKRKGDELKAGRDKRFKSGHKTGQYKPLDLSPVKTSRSVGELNSHQSELAGILDEDDSIDAFLAVPTSPSEKKHDQLHALDREDIAKLEQANEQLVRTNEQLSVELARYPSLQDISELKRELSIYKEVLPVVEKQRDELRAILKARDDDVLEPGVKAELQAEVKRLTAANSKLAMELEEANVVIEIGEECNKRVTKEAEQDRKLAADREDLLQDRIDELERRLPPTTIDGAKAYYKIRPLHSSNEAKLEWIEENWAGPYVIIRPKKEDIAKHGLQFWIGELLDWGKKKGDVSVQLLQDNPVGGYMPYGKQPQDIGLAYVWGEALELPGRASERALFIKAVDDSMENDARMDE
jgi:hypothetical protein